MGYEKVKTSILTEGQIQALLRAIDLCKNAKNGKGARTFSIRLREAENKLFHLLTEIKKV